MKHLAFFYYTVSYSIGLPAIIVFILAYLKTKNKTIQNYLPFLVSITLIMIIVTVLRYQDVVISHPNSYLNIEAKYLYFLAESSLILTLPLFFHALFKFKHAKQGNLLFVILYLLALVLIISPYFLRYIPEKRELFSLPGFAVYRGILFSTIIYNAFLVFLHYRRLSENIGKILLVSVLIYTIIFLFEMLQCDLMPILKHIPVNIPLSPACYFIFNLISLIYIIKKIFLNPVSSSENIYSTELLEHYKITDREKEIIDLLIRGCQNKDISKQLYISESTVKTHIQNIYKKLGVKNRVQLVNSLNEIEE